MLKKMICILILTFITSLAAYAQEKDTVIVENEDGTKDTIVILSDEWESDWDEEWDDKWNFDVFDDFKGRPAISVNYGFSKINRDDFTSSFAKPNLFEVKLGYVTEKLKQNKKIAKYDYKYFRLSNISTELSNKDFDDTELESSSWRFGFGREGGYGWKFGESAIIPYYGYSMDWTRLDMKRFPEVTPPLLPVFDPGTTNDIEILKRYHESFRFGTSVEGGIKFRLIAGITLEAAYERSIVFERHLFWKLAGSAVIEIASQGLLDTFINEITDSSPYAAPIVNFILKNALAYGIYELRQEKMNWPFNSAPPLAFDQFKFGLSFVF